MPRIGGVGSKGDKSSGNRDVLLGCSTPAFLCMFNSMLVAATLRKRKQLPPIFSFHALLAKNTHRKKMFFSL